MRAPLQQADLDAAVALMERMDAVFTIDGMGEPTARIMQFLFLGWTRTLDTALRVHRNGYGAKAEERGMGWGNVSALLDAVSKWDDMLYARARELEAAAAWRGQ